MKVQKLLPNLSVNIAAEGKIQLGVVIGSTEYRDKYLKDLVNDCDNHLPFCQLLQKHYRMQLTVFSICQWF